MKRSFFIVKCTKLIIIFATVVLLFYASLKLYDEEKIYQDNIINNNLFTENVLLYEFVDADSLQINLQLDEIKNHNNKSIDNKIIEEFYILYEAAEESYEEDLYEEEYYYEDYCYEEYEYEVTEEVCVIENSEEVIEEATVEEVVAEEAVEEATEEVMAVAAAAPTTDTSSDLYLLAHLIEGEAGAYWCSDTLQLYVGSVVLNRVASGYFPNSIEGVIWDDGQYSCIWDGNFYREPSQRCWDHAQYLLDNGSMLPSNVIFQSQFPQGDGTYVIEGNMYFCYKN